MPGEISPEVRQFIHRTINSIEQLEVLLFLMSNGDRAWAAEEVSLRTRLPEETVTARLTELHKAKLLALEDAEMLCYRYAPSSEALAQEMAKQLQDAYRERRDTVVQLIYSRPLDNIKIFADAFRLKEED